MKLKYDLSRSLQIGIVGQAQLAFYRDEGGAGLSQEK